MSGKHAPSEHLSLFQFFRLFLEILRPERNFYWLALIYGVGISLLSLATPISVQMLINTVANTGLTAPLVLLSVTLFALLMVSGVLNALRVHLMELFGRRFYARMVAEISLRVVYAQNPFFSDTSRSALFNRYFDIIGVQKAIPVLFIGGFTVLLQVAVGFVLVSLYHPLFLVFNIVLIGFIWLVWGIWGASAVRSAIDLSQAKHRTAAWLETMGDSNGFFKSEKRIEYALDKTEDHTRDYIEQHKHHFRRHFAQTLSFLTIYAAASAALLGVGGWLVIQNQLTLGQLVAAELVLSVAFYGLSQLGVYLNYFYDLCAAVEELSLFYTVEPEERSATGPLVCNDHTLSFNQAAGRGRGEDAVLNLTIPAGAVLMASASDHGIQRLFTNLLKRHSAPARGYVTFGNIDLKEIDAHHLRQNIYVIDRIRFIGMTIREYLRLSCEDTAASQMMPALKTVGLAEVVAKLDDGLDTRLAPSGWPLSSEEVLKLKLANALIARPRVLVLSRLFDVIEEEHLAAAIAQLRDRSDTTVVYFSNRRTDLGFDAFMYLDARQQHFFENFDEFCDAAHGEDRPATDGRVLLTAQRLVLAGE